MDNKEWAAVFLPASCKWVLKDYQNGGDTLIATVAFNDCEEANAHLLAAAPDMERELENLIFQISNNVPWSQVHQAIIDGRKALLKAEGK